MLEQVGHAVLDIGRIDLVVVIEHEHDVIGESVKLVQQRSQDRLDGHRLGGLEKGECTAT